VVIAADSPRDIVDMPSGPTEGGRVTCTLLLETADGAPADPSSFTTVVRIAARPSMHNVLCKIAASARPLNAARPPTLLAGGCCG
jgi:hypothetical protein